MYRVKVNYESLFVQGERYVAISCGREKQDSFILKRIYLANSLFSSTSFADDVKLQPQL